MSQPLPNNITEALIRSIKRGDYIQVASLYNLKDWDLKDVIYRKRNVKPKHIPALQELKKRAISNALQSYNDIQLLKNFEI